MLVTEGLELHDPFTNHYETYRELKLLNPEIALFYQLFMADTNNPSIKEIEIV